MITIFTAPRPFKGEFDIVQRNGIKSWTLLKPECEVILFGSEEGTDRAANDLKVRHISDLETNEFGTPMLNDMLSKARAFASNEILVMLNPDVILTNDFTRAVEKVREEIKKYGKDEFLMAGQRWNVNLKGPINFDDNNWGKDLKEKIKDNGKMLGASGMDYLVFSRDAEFKTSGIAMGRAGVDNCLFYQAKKMGMPTIDATAAVDIIHQNHDYPQKGKVSYKIENQRNIRAIGGFSKMATLRDADWILTKDGLKRPPLLRMIFSKLTLFYPWKNLLGIKRMIQSKI